MNMNKTYPSLFVLLAIGISLLLITLPSFLKENPPKALFDETSIQRIAQMNWRLYNEAEEIKAHTNDWSNEKYVIDCSRSTGNNVTEYIATSPTEDDYETTLYFGKKVTSTEDCVLMQRL